MAIGYLQIMTTYSNSEQPLSNVLITLTKELNQEVVYKYFTISDQNGKTEVIHCMCPSADSLKPSYAIYHVELKKNGYQPLSIQYVKIVEGITNSLEIDMIPLKNDKKIDSKSDFPGHTMSKEELINIQKKMNRIAQELVEIPVHDEYGFMDENMIKSITAFQEHFKLDLTGSIDLITYNKIIEIYHQLNDGTRNSLIYPPFPGTILRIGSHGSDVSFIQSRLKFLSMYYKSLPIIIEDGYYGSLSERCIIAFQSMLGIEEDGLVGMMTWNKIMGIYNELNSL